MQNGMHQCSLPSNLRSIRRRQIVRNTLLQMVSFLQTRQHHLTYHRGCHLHNRHHLHHQSSLQSSLHTISHHLSHQTISHQLQVGHHLRHLCITYTIDHHLHQIVCHTRNGRKLCLAQRSDLSGTGLAMCLLSLSLSLPRMGNPITPPPSCLTPARRSSTPPVLGSRHCR